MSTMVETKTVQIKCINKRDRPNPHERITHVGGHTDRQWKITQEDAIGMIERKEWRFYTVIPGQTKSVWVEVGISRFGNKYVRTEGDSDERNNLLNLPECP